MVPEERFFKFPQCCTKFEKRNLKIAKTPKIIGKNLHNNQRKNKNNDSSSRSRSNNQHNSHKSLTNKPIKKDKKEWPTSSETLKGEGRKIIFFFAKQDHINKDKKKNF